VGSFYFTDMLDVLRAAGCQVRENSTTNGWERRGRSSGGFESKSAVLACFWHHSASSTTPENDLHWQIVSCDDSPVGNCLLDRTGTWWPVAAGASNCAGKGGPASFSRGTIPQDSGNTRGFQIEAANNGVGEPWPQVQIDAYFAGSNAISAYFGNQPSDVITHHVWAPTRKIDPATAAAVEGPWRPRSSTSSGTWDFADIAAECAARAGTTPTPEPPEEDDMALYIVLDPADGQTQWLTDTATFKTKITDPGVAAEGPQLFGWRRYSGDQTYYPLGPGWGPYLDQLPEVCP
jgi:hypothetical protein